LSFQAEPMPRGMSTFIGSENIAKFVSNGQSHHHTPGTIFFMHSPIEGGITNDVPGNM
jgi:hypothetical protein